MKRRSFLGALAGMFAAPAVAMLPAAKPPARVAVDLAAGPSTSAIFKGELGRWSNVSIVSVQRPFQESLNRIASSHLDAIDGLQWSEAEFDRARVLHASPSTFNMLRTLPRSA